MEKVQFLPLGTVVKLKGSIRKVIVVARGLLTIVDNKAMYFDYGGALYPEGILGDQIMYFNHDGIEEIVFKGYENDEDKEMVKKLQEWMEHSDAEKGSPYDINKKNGHVS